jgi:hypothetical protein
MYSKILCVKVHSGGLGVQKQASLAHLDVVRQSRRDWEEITTFGDADHSECRRLEVLFMGWTVCIALSGTGRVRLGGLGASCRPRRRRILPRVMASNAPQSAQGGLLGLICNRWPFMVGALCHILPLAPCFCVPVKNRV